MKIALIGATGNIGSKVLNEALSRSHQVTAIARNTGKLKARRGVTPQPCDLGADQLLKDKDGNSKISREDFAVAMIDELENPKHVRKRFTVGY